MRLSIILAGLAALAVSATKTTKSTPNNTSVCTTTYRTLVQFDLSPTTTVYAKTKTAISKVDCGGCSLRIENFGGHGPVRPKPTATVNKLRTTTTEIVCSPTLKATVPVPHAA